MILIWIVFLTVSAIELDPMWTYWDGSLTGTEKNQYDVIGVSSKNNWPAARSFPSYCVNGDFVYMFGGMIGIIDNAQVADIYRILQYQ